MFSRIRIGNSTKPSSSLERLRQAIDSADAILVGAGAGLSTSAGFTYGGERFRQYFSDFAEKYGFRDMYTGGFYPYQTPEEYWAYWSRDIYINRYLDAPRPVYRDLLRLLDGKDYFVLTTNVDHCFQKAGFDKHRLFYTQGDYGLLQCSRPCCRQTWDNEALIRRMVAEQKDMRVPAGLVPPLPQLRPAADHKPARRRPLCGGCGLAAGVRAVQRFCPPPPARQSAVPGTGGWGITPRSSSNTPSGR